MANLSVSLADLQKSFRRYRQAAIRAPVTITSRGRDSLVLMGVAEYRRLKSRDRTALKVEDLSEQEFRAIVEQELPPELARFDHELASNS